MKWQVRMPIMRHKIMKEEKEEKEEKLSKAELKEEENDSSLALAADLLGGSTSDSNNTNDNAR